MKHGPLDHSPTEGTVVYSMRVLSTFFLFSYTALYRFYSVPLA